MALEQTTGLRNARSGAERLIIGRIPPTSNLQDRITASDLVADIPRFVTVTDDHHNIHHSGKLGAVYTWLPHLCSC